MPNRRKRRTREHIIADLSANHVEYFALKCGFSVERIRADYGYDLQIYCYDYNGEFENGVIYLQVKSTDNIGKYRRTGGYSRSFESEHSEIRINGPMPVIIVLFDAANETAYRTYLQAFIRKTGVPTDTGEKTFAIRFGENDVVSTEDVRKRKKYKDRILSQSKGYRDFNIMFVRFVVPPLGGVAPPEGGTTNRSGQSFC